jgi:catechol 2,3-dioxygenase-like lactoylglutathione lyase family enzyme
MITGAHLLLYSTNADADRAFFRDVLGFRFVDVGHNWLIFALPPAEMAVHPDSGEFVQAHADHKLAGAVLYLMCDDVRATMHSLAAKQVICSPTMEAEWGIATTVCLPSGAEIGLYQPTHPTAIGTGPLTETHQGKV